MARRPKTAARRRREQIKPPAPAKPYYRLTPGEILAQIKASGQPVPKSPGGRMIRVLPRTGKVRDLVKILRSEQGAKPCAKADYLDRALGDKSVICGARFLVACAAEIWCACHQKDCFAPRE